MLRGSFESGRDAGPGAPQGQITHRQLQARLMGFADRYLNRISEAVDSVAAAVGTPVVRVAAQATKYYPGLTVVSIVAESEAEVALRDLLVVVTLERIVWEGAWAEEMFGQHAVILTKAQQEVEEDIWAIARSVMPADQVRTTRELILEWRRRNPDRKYVSSTRFDEVARLRGQEQAGAAFQGFLAPIGEATRAVEETRLLGERALFLASHVPLLVLWQAELLMHEVAAKPETQQLVASSTDMGQAAQRLAVVAERLPRDLEAQRVALMRDLQQTQTSVRQVVADVQGGLREARAFARQVRGITDEGDALVRRGRELVWAVQQTMVTTDRLMSGWGAGASRGTGTGAGGQPFDIREYTQAASQLATTLRELQQVLSAGEELSASPALREWMAQIDEFAAQRVIGAKEAAQDVVRQLFWRGLGLIVAGCAATFGTAFLYRWATHRHGLGRS
jgi:hypothetical protein